MSKVFRHISMASDEYLGRVEPDGNVYESRFGPDRYVGRVELDTGRIYESRLGPDRYVGRADLENGKVYHARMGPDEYLGKVHKNGRCYLHKPITKDLYMGRILDMLSFAHGGGAFMLLILPIIEEVQEETEQKAAQPKLVPDQLGTSME
jgi:hypothetical protein